MANLARRILHRTAPGPDGERADWPVLPGGVDQWLGLQQFGYQGLDYEILPSTAGTLTQTQPGNRVEEPGADYAGYSSLYRGNAVVYSCVKSRLLVFTEARFQFRQRRSGRPGDYFGTPALAPLETPWPGATTGDLLARMLLDVDLTGNAYVARRGQYLRPMRPDWVTIVLGVQGPIPRQVSELDYDVLGYAYHPGGINSGEDPVILLPENVAHFAPEPDPYARFRGMSWLTPVVREVMADGAATEHKLTFFSNAATPNMVIIGRSLKPEQARQIQDAIWERHGGVHNAYDNLVLGGVDDVKVVGATMEQISFKATQGHGETRVAAAAGVPPIIVGLSEGLESATYCLPANERVWTIDGPRPIQEVGVGDVVWSSGGDPSRPSRVTWQGCVGEKLVYEIRTKNRTLRATGNHPVLVRVAGRLGGGDNASRAPSVEWRQVDDLRPGDRVVEAVSLPDLGEVHAGCASPEMARWLGAYVGDGSGAGRGGICLSIPPTDRVRDYYERLTTDLFDVRIGYQPRSFRFASRGVSEMIAMLGFAGTARTKRIPGWVFRMPLQHRLEFLAGLIDTDGSIGARGVGNLGFANRELVEQARALFVSCGIQVSNVAYRAQPVANLPNPGRREFYDIWGFAITTHLDRVPTADPRYQERLRDRRNAPEGGDAWKTGMDPERLGFFTVRSVAPVGVEPVYDISVAGEQSFFAAGIAVHNSNYAQAVRRFADATMRPLWRNAAGSLSRVVDVPGGAELWYDDRDVPFLKEDVTAFSAVQSQQAGTMRTLIDGGFEADAVVDAVTSGDFARLKGKHTGLTPVQLQKPGAGDPPAAQQGDAADGADAAPAANGDGNAGRGAHLLEQFIRAGR
jgi:hypothetical protein